MPPRWLLILRLPHLQRLLGLQRLLASLRLLCLQRLPLMQLHQLTHGWLDLQQMPLIPLTLVCLRLQLP
jgi:hypothetical protein